MMLSIGFGQPPTTWSVDVGVTGGVMAPPSVVGSFYSETAWGPSITDPDLLEFDAPVSRIMRMGRDPDARKIRVALSP